MVTFLSLPQEVRNQILEIAIPARTARPKTLADLEAQKIEIPVGQQIFFCKEDPLEKLRNAASLLLVNKQIHYETKDLLNPRLGSPYELDVKLLYESLLVPTWIRAPLPMEIVPLVKLTLQSLEKFRQVESFRGKNVLDPRVQRMGMAPTYMHDLYCLLTDLLCWDPTVQLHAEDNKRLAIRVLEIDCIDPENKELLAPESQDPGSFAVLQFRAPDLRHLPEPKGVEGIIRPEWLASSIVEHLHNHLLHGVYLPITGQNHYHPYFYSRIGQILIKVNGSVFGNLDVGQILTDIKFSRGCASPIPVENYIDHWILWKEKAMQGRKDRGFKVPTPPSNWKEKTRVAHHYQPEKKRIDRATISRIERISTLDFI